MFEKLRKFYRESFRNFFEATVNFFIFLPYFFSVKNLLQTLFVPWKHLVAKKTTVGFAFDEWLERVAFNAISGLIGFFMRVSIIFFYFLVQSIALLLLPFVLLIYFLVIPILFFMGYGEKNEEQKKEKSRLNFLGTHLLNQENYAIVASWFEDYYAEYLHSTQWWKRSSLFSIPPLARDWSTGFTPTLDQYGQDITSSTYHMDTKNIVDREKEIGQMERALVKSRESNVVIVGEQGVGKHTIVVALAKKMYEGKTNALLMYKRIVKLNMERIMNQSTDIHQREEFFEQLLEEAAEAKNVILFIDNFEKYISTHQDNIDLSASLEKYLKSNRIQFIGVTTPFFYQKFMLPNDRISQLFTKVDVKEVNQQEAEKILLRVSFILERRHHVSIPYETIKNAVVKSDFYITNIPFPEKTIDLLDSACVYLTSRRDKTDTSPLIVTPEVVDKVLTEKTHVPTTLTSDVKDKLVHLETLLLSQVVHQDQAVKELSSTLRRSFLLMGKRKKPMASFLFLGPTGVGKTETAKALAKIFFGSDVNMSRFDMSNYQSTDNISTLIGSMDTANPGLLSKAIRESPYGVLLLDEIEKANKDLLNIFLTILDEGYFTDGFGKRVDCKNLVIIATSNAGADIWYTNQVSATKGEVKQSSESMVNYLVERKIFNPEFLNRFDGVVAFNTLDTGSVSGIAKKMVDSIATDIFNLHKIKVTVSDQYLDSIIKEGYDEKFGARNLDRLLRNKIEDKIAKLILENKVKEGDTIHL